MRHLAAKDKKRRIYFKDSEMDQFIFKVLGNNKTLVKDKKSVRARVKAYYRFARKDQFLTRVRNRCVITGKAGWVFNKFKISRMQFREMFGKGFLYGLKRSSW